MDEVEVDFIVRNHGSVWTFEPVTKNAKDFTRNDLDVQSWQWMGKAFGVDARIGQHLFSSLENNEGFVMELG